MNSIEIRWDFMGHEVSEKRVSMSVEKCAAVQNWPEPTTVKELQRFLGFY